MTNKTSQICNSVRNHQNSHALPNNLQYLGHTVVREYFCRAIHESYMESLSTESTERTEKNAASHTWSYRHRRGRRGRRT